MSRISRHILAGALILIFLSSGCGVISRPNPTPVWTVPPGGPVLLPTATVPAPITPTGTSLVPIIPITGENVVSMQCQFCVADETHAILIFPDFAYFDVGASTAVTCLTADVVNGNRIVICRGPQSTTFNLKICSDSSNCLEFPVALQPCPLLQAGATPLATYTPFAPVFLTPINTLKAPIKVPTGTPVSSIPSSTALPSTGIPATPTIPPPVIGTPIPTQQPPTSQPTTQPTSQPTTAPTQPPPPPPPPTIQPTKEPAATPTDKPKPTKKPTKTANPANGNGNGKPTKSVP